MSEFKTWATLKPETPINHLFFDGRVPILSPLPIIPREEGAPPCYLVPGELLTNEQIKGLAELVWQQWRPECEAIAYIRKDGLLLRTDCFTGFTSIDQGMMMSLAEFGEEMKRTYEDEEYDNEENEDEDWDDDLEEEDR